MRPPNPPETDEHDVRNVRGLMLAAALKPEALALLLGCSTGEALIYQDRAIGRMCLLQRRVLQARGVR